MLAVSALAVENAFLESVESPAGEFLWSEVHNWTLGRIPTTTDVIQIGHAAEEVSATILSAVPEVTSVEIAEYGQDGGWVNHLTVGPSGDLQISNTLVVGKDKHGVLSLQGGEVVCGHTILVGGYDRGEGSRGEVYIESGRLSAARFLYVGRNAFFPRTVGSAVHVSGGELHVGEKIEIDSKDPEQPGVISISGTGSLVLDSGELRLRHGMLKMDGPGVSISVPQLVADAQSTIELSGDGVGSLLTTETHLGLETQLDVSSLNLADGEYEWLRADVLQVDGLFFSDAVDRTMWQLQVDDDLNRIVLIKGAGEAQYDLLVAGGTGSGMYLPGDPIQISAESAAQGLRFDRWEGAGIADPDEPETIVTMRSTDQLVRAVFVPIHPPHELDVTGGTGSGDYGMDQLVTLMADEPAPGERFYKWEGDSGIADPFSKETSYLMPNCG